MNATKRVLAGACFALLACLGGAAQGSLQLNLVAGPDYVHSVWFGPIPAKLRPQAAFWLETAEGAYVATIFVTARSATADWKAAKGARRPEALPIWSHARGIRAADGLYMPDGRQPMPDVVSGATPNSSFALTWKAPASLAPGLYRLRAELNASFDWNQAYPDKLPASDPRRTEANGQPSILYEGLLRLGSGPAEARLAAVGSGSLDGSDGALRPGLEGLTSALGMASEIRAVWRQ